MGHIQFELGNFQESAKSYRTLAQLKPQYAMGWFNLAVSLERSDAWDDASEAFTRHARSIPSTWRPNWPGRLPPADGRPQVRLGLSSVAWNSPPITRTRCSGKAVAMQSLGHPDEASQIYQRILKRNPESEESLSNLILIGMSKQNFEMVREHSERLLELHPESTVALEGLASWASSAGEHGLTAKFCTLLVSAVPGHFEAGSTWRWRTRNPSAGSRPPKPTTKRSSCAPQSCEAYTNLGIVREQLGDEPGARPPPTTRAMKANPEALAPIWNVALLLEHSGLTEEAERWYKQVLEKAPKEDEARFRLAICGSSGKTTGAQPRPSKAA